LTVPFSPPPIYPLLLQMTFALFCPFVRATTIFLTGCQPGPLPPPQHLPVLSSFLISFRSFLISSLLFVPEFTCSSPFRYSCEIAPHPTVTALPLTPLVPSSFPRSLRSSPLSPTFLQSLGLGVFVFFILLPHLRRSLAEYSPSGSFCGVPPPPSFFVLFVPSCVCSFFLRPVQPFPPLYHPHVVSRPHPRRRLVLRFFSLTFSSSGRPIGRVPRDSLVTISEFYFLFFSFVRAFVPCLYVTLFHPPPSQEPRPLATTQLFWLFLFELSNSPSPFHHAGTVPFPTFWFCPTSKVS